MCELGWLGFLELFVLLSEGYPPGGYLGWKSNCCNKIASVGSAKILQSFDLRLKYCQQMTYWRSMYWRQKKPRRVAGAFLISPLIVPD